MASKFTGKMTGQLQIRGIGVSPGISIGQAFVIKRNKQEVTGVLLENEDRILPEIEKFDQAVKISITEIETLIAAADETWTDESIEILEMQIEFLSDPEIRESVVDKISNQRKNVRDAVIQTIDDVVQMFLAMTDEYMRARSADVQDIGNRIYKNLESTGTANSEASKQSLPPDSILIAEDISPSDTISLDTKNVIGFVTQIGGKTSHAAIVAKARGVPAVLGCGEILTQVERGDLIVADGQTGIVMVNPPEETLDLYRAKREEYLRQSGLLKALKNVKAKTPDGLEIQMMANISGAGDMEQVFDNGGEGVGLLRSELLFMGRDSFPTEDEQFEFYKKIALKSLGKPVTIRTIDIGGDKQLPYFNLPQEQNPFLGYRAIRICLDQKELFLVQLRAILRAGVFGNLKLMFPMISSVQEIRQARAVLEEAKQSLVAENIRCAENIEVGIMIEIPSAAVMADVLAKEVDFLSIGTNDLIQYTLAVDRMNEKVSHLYEPFNPGVLRLIANVISEGEKHNIHVAVCGEMASDPLATRLLLGMGLKEFSMSAVSIPEVKNIIINTSLSDARKVYEEVNCMSSSDEITNFLSAAAL
jgi:phosphoenolpyruvate-protein phosphotransferase (PTS system enzyme I)